MKKQSKKNKESLNIKEILEDTKTFLISLGVEFSEIDLKSGFLSKGHIISVLKQNELLNKRYFFNKKSGDLENYSENEAKELIKKLQKPKGIITTKDFAKIKKIFQAIDVMLTTRSGRDGMYRFEDKDERSYINFDNLTFSEETQIFLLTDIKVIKEMKVTLKKRSFGKRNTLIMCDNHPDHYADTMHECTHALNYIDYINKPSFEFPAGIAMKNYFKKTFSDVKLKMTREITRKIAREITREIITSMHGEIWGNHYAMSLKSLEECADEIMTFTVEGVLKNKYKGLKTLSLESTECLKEILCAFYEKILDRTKTRICPLKILKVIDKAQKYLSSIGRKKSTEIQEILKSDPNSTINKVSKAKIKFEDDGQKKEKCSLQRSLITKDTSDKKIIGALKQSKIIILKEQNKDKNENREILSKIKKHLIKIFKTNYKQKV